MRIGHELSAQIPHSYGFRSQLMQKIRAKGRWEKRRGRERKWRGKAAERHGKTHPHSDWSFNLDSSSNFISLVQNASSRLSKKLFWRSLGVAFVERTLAFVRLLHPIHCSHSGTKNPTRDPDCTWRPIASAILSCQWNRAQITPMHWAPWEWKRISRLLWVPIRQS